ncbi:uncharacterized protein SCHCODRAFT_02505791 [Schizophyllum commune H4-8]|uniref:Expressed protein n=1 Tax=Schizophyllum commune (strain H4-8 / FGSC 9210) TaxID=578458 RepID=D8Q6C8_SCHCM|nr:uncharacterized protein SCHCODRAFT_02505791 [Schizophyllum commune H4-8]KAI5891004.1 hypothetical protein SCHCODRAFT_02505791 [Schizophyllum commune H4-8]
MSSKLPHGPIKYSNPRRNSDIQRHFLHAVPHKSDMDTTASLVGEHLPLRDPWRAETQDESSAAGKEPCVVYAVTAYMQDFVNHRV